MSELAAHEVVFLIQLSCLLMSHLQDVGAVPDPACLAWIKSKLQLVSMMSTTSAH
jgi:hypothetical protein